LSAQTPANYIQNNHLAKSTFLRLSAPSTIGGLIIYFDCDILFLENWSQIENFTTIIETQNLCVGARKHWGQISSDSNRAIIESKNRYFNSGVLIMNTNAWRDAQLDLKCEQTILDYTRLSFEFADQCVLNYVLKGEYFEINMEFNSIPEELHRRRTKLLHFAGSIKPWTVRINTSTKNISPVECIRLRDIQIEQRRAFKIYRKLEKEVINFLTKNNLLQKFST
jgi:lipopolysaccharide biosynthesis glycosyltransferase